MILNQVGKKTMKLVMGFLENQRVGNKFLKVGRKNPIVGKKIQKVGNTTASVSPQKVHFQRNPWEWEGHAAR
ncbi:hypothetical protein ASG66_03975 [Bacillus sp. Leaf406]|nr:hypothetical protein ASG66_03975 [Bacillus sp. Leaf406]